MPSTGTKAFNWIGQCNRDRLAGLGAEQIPPIAGDIEEHRNLAVGLGSRGGHELDAAIGHSLMSGGEIVNLQEESDPPGDLIADDRSLLLTVGAGQQQPGLRPWWPDDDPSLRATVVRQGRRVLGEVKAQHIDKELDGSVIVIDNESNQINPH